MINEAGKHPISASLSLSSPPLSLPVTLRIQVPILPTVLMESDSFSRKKRREKGGLNTQTHPQDTFSLDGPPFLLSYLQVCLSLLCSQPQQLVELRATPRTGMGPATSPGTRNAPCAGRDKALHCAPGSFWDPNQHVQELHLVTSC